MQKILQDVNSYRLEIIRYSNRNEDIEVKTKTIREGYTKLLTVLVVAELALRRTCDDEVIVVASVKTFTNTEEEDTKEQFCIRTFFDIFELYFINQIFWFIFFHSS